MSDESKYYTPTIEEFYVGFECELKNSSDEPFEWEPFKIISVDDAEIRNSKMDWSFYDTQNAIADKSIRVKYLDQKDIESLGWKYIVPIDSEFTIDNYYTFIINIPEPNKTTILFKLRMIGDILDIWSDDTGTHYFNGNIKNKSELKKLMQQLQIL